MRRAYKFHNPEGIYFISFATVAWADVFTRKCYTNILIESIAHCIANKGLKLHA
jgi:putative transposase